MSSVELKSIVKKYGEVTAVASIDLSVESGEFVTLLGPSGCGKTTTLRMVAGFIRPTSGTLSIGDVDMTGVPPHQRTVGLVFQNYALFPHMTVRKNVEFGLKMQKVLTSERGPRVQEALELVQLEALGERMPGELSGGQQQRVALARAIICEPKIILLDEPLGALDAELRKQMQLFLKEIQKKINIAFIFITHDQEEAIFLSDRIAVLNEHKFEQIGTPKELYYKPSTPYLAKFFGECNLFECNIINIKNDIILLDSHLGKFETKTKSKNIKVRDDIIYGIRPEEIAITDIKKDNSIELIIKDIDFKGPNSILHLTNKSRNLTIKLQKISSNISKTYTIDSVIHINFNIESGNVFLK